MTTAQPSSRRSAAKRIELAAIPILAAILAAVLYGNANSQRGAVIPAPQRLERDGQTVNAQAAPRAASSPSGRRAAPEYELQEIIALNPFEPAPGVEAERTDVASALVAAATLARVDERLATDGRPSRSFAEAVTAIHARGARSAALIGSRIVRAGDVLESGARVAAIRADGVVLVVDGETSDRDADAPNSPRELAPRSPL